MHAAGYTDERWYAIGARYAHGFIVTTRLERLGDDGEATPTQERWSRRFPEASTLFWLEGARTMQLPARARYRVLLIAFTDLPIGPTRQAISRSEETWMAERPGSPATESPVTLRGPTGYHYGVYVYEYRSERSDGEGAFLSSDMTISGATLAPVAGLSPLVRVQSAER